MNEHTEDTIIEVEPTIDTVIEANSKPPKRFNAFTLIVVIAFSAVLFFSVGFLANKNSNSPTDTTVSNTSKTPTFKTYEVDGAKKYYGIEGSDALLIQRLYNEQYGVPITDAIKQEKDDPYENSFENIAYHETYFTKTSYGTFINFDKDNKINSMILLASDLDQEYNILSIVEIENFFSLAISNLSTEFTKTEEAIRFMKSNIQTLSNTAPNNGATEFETVIDDINFIISASLDDNGNIASYSLMILPWFSDEQ